MSSLASDAVPAPSRVLIVDDAPENLRILSESLRGDYTIMFAKNGRDALRLAGGEPAPDIILLDVIMPGMNGYDVCRRLKELPRTRDIPVMFITAQHEEADEAEGLSLGAQDYIKSPSRPRWCVTAWPTSSNSNATATTSRNWWTNAPGSWP